MHHLQQQPAPRVYTKDTISGVHKPNPVVVWIWTDPLPLHALAVGGVVGFSLVYGGKDAVIWWQQRPDFPYIGGMVPIFVSWILSPTVAALFSYILFVVTRTLVLRRPNSTKVAYWVSGPARKLY